MNNIKAGADSLLQETAGARLAEAAASAAAQVLPGKLRAINRGQAPVARARQRAMYLAHIAFGLSLTRVGVCFGRDRTTVRHACALIEDSRDDPRCEFGLSALEAGLLAISVRLSAEPQEALR